MAIQLCLREFELLARSLLYGILGRNEIPPSKLRHLPPILRVRIPNNIRVRCSLLPEIAQDDIEVDSMVALSLRVEQPNKPMVATAPATLTGYAPDSLRRHIGQPLDLRAVSGVRFKSQASNGEIAAMFDRWRATGGELRAMGDGGPTAKECLVVAGVELRATRGANSE